MHVRGATILAVAIGPVVVAASARSTPARAQGRAPGAPPGMVTIDFRACRHHGERVWTAEGSTTYLVLGVQGMACRMRYGGEVEDPRWDGRLPIVCLVPRRLGSIAFGISPYRVDFSPIGRYCR